VLNLGSVLRNPFSFLFTRSTKEEQVVAYLTREHRRGRTLADILTDRPELVRALGEHDVAQAREAFSGR
jgi:hypothetical protein